MINDITCAEDARVSCLIITAKITEVCSFSN